MSTTIAPNAILSAVRELAPAILARAADIEKARRLPPDLVASLRTAGVFRMFTPARFGGCAIDIPSSIEILTELAIADGATGWTVMIGCHAPILFSRLAPSTFEALYANGPDLIAAGSTLPKGTAEPVDGGYRVSGGWPCASGCEHADWIYAVCAVKQSAGPTAAPPQLQFISLPAREWRILDTWHSAGLRGTGSHDISLSDAYVPTRQAADFFAPGMTDPRDAHLYMAFHQTVLHLGAIAVGIAEGALAEMTALGQAGRRRVYARHDLADTGVFQHHVGRAEADVHAARAYLRAVATELWAHTLARNIDATLATRVMQATTWIAETCARAVDACFRACGASVIYESSPLQRRLRDIHTLGQHIMAQEGAFALAGAQRLGRAPAP